MIKNRTAQIIFQTVYCTLGLVGTVASFGIFDDMTNLRWDFYVHFTNVSNYFCIAVMLAALVQTAKKKQDSSVTAAHMMKFIGIMGVLLTFLVFNFFLAGAEGRNPQFNWRVGSVCFHIVLPVMYIADWFLFYERRAARWYYPFASVGFPLAYAIFILLQAVILNFDSSILIPFSTTPLIYPYFFLNLETQGVGGVALWLLALFVLFVAIGYLFYGLSKIGSKRAAAALPAGSAGAGE